jgi:microcystin-dependent protein
MANPFIGEIKLVGFSFAPVGWAFCNGALVAIAQNPALFQLIGTTYGGDGQNTFGLPNLQGRVPIHFGNAFVQGQLGGSEGVSLTSQQVPNHAHTATQCSSKPGTSGTPTAGSIWAGSAKGSLYNNNAPSVNMAANTLGPAGNGQPHNNLQPSLAINYIIALEGIYPTQN